MQSLGFLKKMKRFKKHKLALSQTNQTKVGMRSHAPAIDTTSFRPRVRSRHIVGLVVFISIVVALTQIYLSISFTSKGTELAVLLAKKEALREENDILKTELASNVSVSHIALKAQSLGLEKPKTVVFIKPQDQDHPIAFEASLTRKP